MHSKYAKVDEPMWVYPKEDTAWKEAIVKEFKIHPVMAQALVSREFKSLESIHDFLYAKLPDISDPFLLAEMPQAVDRIIQAIDTKENILIYGDNDVDGMTGTALLTDFLQFIGANVFFYLSSRGITRDNLFVEALEYAAQNQCTLMVTVDCGITAAQEIAKVAAKGIDVIVTDHHEPTDKIPHCVATLNPKLVNNTYPNRDLTGVGVAFKLAHAVTNQLVEDGKISPKKIDLKRNLDLVALGTIADMGTLREGDSRIFVRYGLRQLKKEKRVGLAKLMQVSDMDASQVNTFSIATKIAPRLNSLGRIADPKKGVELLLVRNVQAAEKMAEELNLNNTERQKIERTMSQDVDQMILERPELLKNRAIVMYSDKWHPGVIAILSTRICKHFNRPTVMIAVDEGLGKGSLRSIHEMPLLDALKECSDLLINFGGHDFAAGMTIKPENIPAFQERFIQIANKKLSEMDVMNKLMIDAEVRFDEITFDFMESMKLLEPYGNENPQPVLYSVAKQAWPPKVVGKTHLKMYLEQDGRMLEGIFYNKADLSPKLRKKNLQLEVAFTPQVNTYQGMSIQLLIRDFKILEEKT